MSREFQFYIVPTPIGNIKDITFRAIEILNDVDIIACEDTRLTQKLLNHYDITTKCVSCHKYNEHERVEFFLREISCGKKIALVSDAGSPMICDPGNVVIQKLKEHNISITSLPGACAVTTFLSQLPREEEAFTFIGFIPRTANQIESVVKQFNEANILFYDSPERILKTLEIIQEIRGDIKIALGRELSKLFEEVIVDNISAVLDHYKDGIKGEIICMLYKDRNVKDIIDVDFKIRELKNKGFKDKEISVILASLFNLNKNDVYKRTLLCK